MTNDKNEQQELNYFDEPTIEKKEGEGFEKKPSLIKFLKEEFKGDNKPMHRVRIKFLTNGVQVEIPDTFGANKGQPLTKRVFDVEYKGNEYALFVNKSLGPSSLYTQVKDLGLRNKRTLINVSCDLNIVGKIGEKEMRYALEDVSSPSGVPVNPEVKTEVKQETKPETKPDIKDYTETEWKIVQEIKSMCKEKKRFVTLNEICKGLGLSAEQVNLVMVKLFERDTLLVSQLGNANVFSVRGDEE